MSHGAPSFKRKAHPKRCCHLPLTLWLFSSSSIHSHPPSPDSVFSAADSSQIQLLFEEGYAEEMGSSLSTLLGDPPWVGPPLREMHLPLTSSRKQFLAIDDRGFTLLQLARWILRWFIRLNSMLCRWFFFSSRRKPLHIFDVWGVLTTLNSKSKWVWKPITGTSHFVSSSDDFRNRGIADRIMEVASKNT